VPTSDELLLNTDPKFDYSHLPIAEHVIAMTVRQAAQVLNVSERTVENLIAGGHLPVLRIGRAVRILSDELQRFMRRGVVEIAKAVVLEKLADGI
jgi:excisionase family DNA binding protein